MNQQNPAPTGAWTHSFEEDEGDLLVFRPSMSFSFPPSRRFRETLVFEGDSVTSGMPGPDDRTQHSSGSITVLGNNLFRFEEGERSGQVFEMVEVNSDRLVLRPQ